MWRSLIQRLKLKFVLFSGAFDASISKHGTILIPYFLSFYFYIPLSQSFLYDVKSICDVSLHFHFQKSVY